MTSTIQLMEIFIAYHPHNSLNLIFSTTAKYIFEHEKSGSYQYNSEGSFNCVQNIMREKACDMKEKDNGGIQIR